MSIIDLTKADYSKYKFGDGGAVLPPKQPILPPKRPNLPGGGYTPMIIERKPTAIEQLTDMSGKYGGYDPFKAELAPYDSVDRTHPVTTKYGLDPAEFDNKAYNKWLKENRPKLLDFKGQIDFAKESEKLEFLAWQNEMRKKTSATGAVIGGFLDSATSGVLTKGADYSTKAAFKYGDSRGDYVGELDTILPSRRLAKERAEHPIAAIAGDVTGGVAGIMLMKGAVNAALGNVPKFAELPFATQQTISRIATFSGSGAISTAARTDWSKAGMEDVANVVESAVVGGMTAYLGGKMSKAVGDQVLVKLANSDLSARAVKTLTSMAGALAYAATSTATHESSKIADSMLKNKEYKPDVAGIAVNFTTTLIWSGLQAYVGNFNQTAPYRYYQNIENYKYFTKDDLKDMDSLKAKQKELAFKYHPDQGGSNAAMAEINQEYTAAKKVIAGNVVAEMQQQAAKGEVSESTVKNAASVYNGVVDDTTPDVPILPPKVEQEPILPPKRGRDTNVNKIVQEYNNSVDSELVAFAKHSIENPDDNYSNKELAPVKAREALDIKKLLGIDTLFFKHNIKSGRIRHIIKRHGKNGTQDSSMANLENLGRLQYVIDNYDSIEILRNKKGEIEYSSEFKNADGSYSPMVLYKKQINGTYYLVEAAPDSKAKKLQVVSAYIQPNKKGTGHVPNSNNAPEPYVQDERTNTVPNTNIPQPETDVNPQTPTEAVKAQQYRARQETGFINKIAQLLSVPGKASKESLRPIANELAQEFMRTGDISKESVDALFEKAYSEGIVINEDFYNQYKGLKEELKTRRIAISDADHVGNIGKTKTPFSVDFCIGDIIVPSAVERMLPVLLAGFEQPKVYTYSLESTVSEKIDAIISLMELTGRMKDFYDIYYLATTFAIHSRGCCAVIIKVFAHCFPMPCRMNRIRD